LVTDDPERVEPEPPVEEEVIVEAKDSTDHGRAVRVRINTARFNILITLIF
jgi:hypothetical protein